MFEVETIEGVIRIREIGDQVFVEFEADSWYSCATLGKDAAMTMADWFICYKMAKEA